MEKDRPEYVQKLETQLRHLQAEHDKYKSIALYWEPKITVVVDPDRGLTEFGLELGGKLTHASVQNSYLSTADAISTTTAVVNALVESLVVEKLRAIVQPKVEAVIKNAQANVGAGKW